MYKGRSKRKAVERRGLNPSLWTWKRSKANKWKWNGHPRNKENGNPVNGTRILSTTEVLSPLGTYSGEVGNNPPSIRRLARKDYSKEEILDHKCMKIYYSQGNIPWMQDKLNRSREVRKTNKKESITLSNWSTYSLNKQGNLPHYTMNESESSSLNAMSHHDHIISALECQCDVLRWRSLRCSSIEEAREWIEKGRIRYLSNSSLSTTPSTLKAGNRLLKPGEGRKVNKDTWTKVGNTRKSWYTDPRNAMVNRNYRCVDYSKGIRVFVRYPYDDEVYYPLGTRPMKK